MLLGPYTSATVSLTQFTTWQSVKNVHNGSLLETSRYNMIFVRPAMKDHLS